MLLCSSIAPSDTETYTVKTAEHTMWRDPNPSIVEGKNCVCLFSGEPVRPFTKHEPFKKVYLPPVQSVHTKWNGSEEEEQWQIDEKYVETFSELEIFCETCHRSRHIGDDADKERFRRLNILLIEVREESTILS